MDPHIPDPPWAPAFAGVTKGGNSPHPRGKLPPSPPRRGFLPSQEQEWGGGVSSLSTPPRRWERPDSGFRRNDDNSRVPFLSGNCRSRIWRRKEDSSRGQEGSTPIPTFPHRWRKGFEGGYIWLVYFFELALDGVRVGVGGGCAAGLLRAAGVAGLGVDGLAELLERLVQARHGTLHARDVVGFDGFF